MDILDLMGQILFYSALGTPLLTVPIMWKFSKFPKVISVIIGLILAFLLSIIILVISLGICFRNGLGPD